MKQVNTIKILCFSICALLLTACDATSSQVYPDLGTPSLGYTLEDILLPEQPGQRIYEQANFTIDYSNAAYGYISVKAPDTSSLLKLQVLKDDATYTYDLVPLEYVVVPLQAGDGSYTLRCLSQKEGSTYSVSASTQIDVVLNSELTPYLYPNQIVNYTQDTLAVLKSFELTQNADSELERVYEVYTYITQNITYDYDKAERAKLTFILPIIDETYIQEKGICFDYAALMSAMLRVQHIPTRVVTGVTDLGYHAWVEVYIQDQGWINPSIYFNSSQWKLVDPTFDAMGAYEGTYQTKDYY